MVSLLALQIVFVTHERHTNSVSVSEAEVREMINAEVPPAAQEEQVIQFLRSHRFRFSRYSKGEWKANIYGPFAEGWPQASSRVEGVIWSTSKSDYASGYIEVEFYFGEDGKLLGNSVSSKASER